jgi:polar amino acid transport system permease protein
MYGFAGACILGMLVALARTSRSRALRALGYLYTELLKNLPFVTGIFIIYFGLPGVGLTLDAFKAGVVCLAVFYGAYLGEIFRGGLQGVPLGQMEAGAALGLTSSRVLLLVRLPQALRLALPATATMLVDLLKGTAILVTIGGNELMTQATIITSDTFRPLEVYLVVGAMYMVMCWPLSRLSNLLERQLNKGAALSYTALAVRRTADRLTAAPMTLSAQDA